MVLAPQVEQGEQEMEEVEVRVVLKVKAQEQKQVVERGSVEKGVAVS